MILVLWRLSLFSSLSFFILFLLCSILHFRRVCPLPSLLPCRAFYCLSARPVPFHLYLSCPFRPFAPMHGMSLLLFLGCRCSISSVSTSTPYEYASSLFLNYRRWCLKTKQHMLRVVGLGGFDLIRFLLLHVFTNYLFQLTS